MDSSVKNDNLRGEEAREALEYLESTRPRCFSGNARFNTFKGEDKVIMNFHNKVQEGLYGQKDVSSS